MENPSGYVVTNWFVVAGWKIPWAAELSAWLALLRFVVIVRKVPWDNLVGCPQSCLLKLLPVQTTVHSIPHYRSSLCFFNEVQWCCKGTVLWITTTVICMISAGLDSLPAKRQNSPLKDLRRPRLQGIASGVTEVFGLWLSSASPTGRSKPPRPAYKLSFSTLSHLFRAKPLIDTEANVLEYPTFHIHHHLLLLHLLHLPNKVIQLSECRALLFPSCLPRSLIAWTTGTMDLSTG